MENFDYKSKAQELLEYIGEGQKTISVVLHKNPDGDSMGAGLAFSIWLQKQGHNVKVISPNRYSETFAWLPNSINVLIHSSPLFHESSLEYFKSSDIVVCVDYGQKKRLDDILGEGISNKEKVITIDHHLDEIEFSGYKCSNTIAASTCEIVYELLKEIDPNAIDPDIAKCLYTGIVTDTGRFMTSNMTSRVHEIAADLLKNYSIDAAMVFNYLYGSNRYSRLKLLGHLLNRCLRTIKGYNVAYIYLSLEDASKYKIFPGDTDGIVNYALSIKNVILAAMFKEKEDGVYISFRSIGDFAVNEFAGEHFNGGGHKNASGGSSKLTLRETINKFEEIVKNIDELKYVEQQ